MIIINNNFILARIMAQIPKEESMQQNQPASGGEQNGTVVNNGKIFVNRLIVFIKIIGNLYSKQYANFVYYISIDMRLF
jgi:hypothetical protein